MSMDQKFLQREEPYDQERDKGLNSIFKLQKTKQ